MTTNLSNLKIIWEHFKIVVSSTSTLPLPQQASFDSNVFQNLLFSYKMICFYFSPLNYIIKLNIAVFYQFFYNCQCNPVFVVADLRKKHDLKMTRWQLLGSIFSSVYFSENFTTPVVFFYSEASFYSQVNFSIKIYLNGYGFYGKVNTFK